MLTTTMTMLLGLGSLGLCPPPPETVSGEGYLVETDRSWAIVALDRDRARGSGAIPTGMDNPPSVVGSWEPVESWEVIAIHASLLPNGHVLHYSYPAATVGSRARTWDPATGAFTVVNMPTNLFCSGLSQMADGRVLITGGTDPGCEFRGYPFVHAFDPATGQVSYLGDMIDGRWYPTNISMPDGRTLIISGLDRDCANNADMEVYTPGQPVEIIPAGELAMPLFPRAHILSNGDLAVVGPQPHVLIFNGQGWQHVANSNLGARYEGTSVLIPGRTDQILTMGGIAPLTATCEIIDFSGGSTPTVAYTTPMHNARAHADAVILPDKTVLVVGGGRLNLYEQPVNVPELFDPEAETWQELAPHTLGRMYHATSVLLPDGRVLVAGQDNGESAYSAEIYHPPYLFRAKRPVIDQVPPQISYGQSFDIASADAAGVESVVLVKTATVTHSVTFDQRLVELEHTASREVMTGTAPAHENLAPPGYYMLFIVNSAGVPSEARMVRLTDCHADLDLDGDTDQADLGVLLASWDRGAGGDLDGDGDTDQADLGILLANYNCGAPN